LWCLVGVVCWRFGGGCIGAGGGRLMWWQCIAGGNGDGDDAGVVVMVLEVLVLVLQVLVAVAVVMVSHVM